MKKLFSPIGILLAVMLFGITPPVSAQWAYKVPVTITNPSGAAIQSFQARVNLDASFNFAGALSDGSDVRIMAQDGTTLLPFWIENWNPAGHSAIIWVKLPTLPTSGTQIYIYYGNPNPTIPQSTLVSVPPTGPFQKASANPIIPIGDPGNGANLLAEDIVHDAVTGHYWMVFSNYRDGSVGLAWSDTPANSASWNWYASNPITGNANSPHLVSYQGTWYLFYGNGAANQIAYSTASDIRGPYSNPVVILSPTTGWESQRVLEPYVFQRDDGTWILMYMGDSGNTTEQVGYATASSPAGPYTRYSANPVLAFGAPGTIDSGTIADPWVVRYQDPNSSQVTYYIGYAASSTNGSPWQTAYATTTDWKTFYKQGILLPLSEFGWDSVNSFRGAVTMVGDTYVMSYTGDNYEMGIATQPAMIPSPSIVNNPLAVFDFFDGFTSNSLDSSKWYYQADGSGGTATVSNGLLQLNAVSDGYIRMWGNPTFGSGYTTEVHGQHVNVAQSPDALFETGFDGVDFGSILRMQDYPVPQQLSADASANGSDAGFISMSAGIDANMHTFQVYRAPDGTAQFLLDGVLRTTVPATNAPSGNLQPWLMSFADSSVTASLFQADWVRVRKSIGNDDLSIVGSEQTTKVQPTIVWNQSANITSGTKLSATQLDATANVPGKFVYSPASGTVLPAGTSILSVTFTPTDTNHYTTTTASVSITVNVNGNLTISNGQTYNFVNDKISGNLTMTGGTLILNNSTVSGNLQMSGGNLSITNGSAVQGNLQISGNSIFSINSSRISGNLQIQNTPVSVAQNQICGTIVNGNLQFQNNDTAILIGLSTSCIGNTISGNLQVTNNSAATQIYGDTVSGNLQVTGNTAGTQVDKNRASGNLQVQNNSSSTAIFSNSAKGNLQCSGNNSKLITGGGNTASQKQGQCASF